MPAFWLFLRMVLSAFLIMFRAVQLCLEVKYPFTQFCWFCSQKRYRRSPSFLLDNRSDMTGPGFWWNSQQQGCPLLGWSMWELMWLLHHLVGGSLALVHFVCCFSYFIVSLTKAQADAGYATHAATVSCNYPKRLPTAVARNFECSVMALESPALQSRMMETRTRPRTAWRSAQWFCSKGGACCWL